MRSFDDLGDSVAKRPPPEAEQIVEIEVSFDCQVCDEPVNTARYSATIGEVRWLCSKGHRSFLKEFYV